MPEDETSNQPPYDPGSMSWEGTTSDGAHIAQWEHRRFEFFHAAIVAATSSGDAGVLGNFPQELEQELKPEVERVLALLAEKTEWFEALEEEVQRLEQIIKNKDKELAFRDWGIGPPSPLRPPSLN